MLEIGETLAVPLVERAPLQPPLAVQLEALVDDQLRVVALPATIDGFDTPSVTVGWGAGGGGGSAVTLIVTLAERLPPAPLQVRV